MARSDSPLIDAFARDHRVLTTGLSRILEALEHEHDSEAVALAEELDTAIGPHIEFEEESFYPELRAAYDSGFVDQLYREHAVGQAAVRALLSANAPLDDEERAELVRDFETALRHAESCGTLASHLENLDDDRQRELLEHLRESRKSSARWTERPARSPGT